MKNFSRYLSALAAATGIFLAVYYFVRVYFFVAAKYGPGDWIFGFFLIAGETYLIIHSFGYVVSIARLARKKQLYRSAKISGADWPPVAILVAVRHEPKEVLEQTFVTFASLDYPRKKVYLLDGSDEEKFLADDRALAKKYGATFFHPAHLHGAKAGIINDFLQKIDEKYVAVFDVDQNPFPDFLKKVVAIAEASEKIAFVQTPQFYSNLGTSPIARGSQMQQSVFFESICESKGSVNAMFCCGTNVLFRRSALLEVGGFDEESITEDFATSVKLHARGYRSVYYNHVRVFGMAPESLPGYLRQQARWAGGTVTVFRRLFSLFLRHPLALSLNQWWEYFLSSTYYFTGWAFFFLMLSPVAFLVFNVPSYFMSPHVYLAIFVPYFFMTLSTFYATMKKRNYRLAEVYDGIILGSLSFPVLMRATLKSLFGKKLAFKITPKGKAEKLNFLELWPWIGMIGLNLLALAFGYQRLAENPYAIGINMFWCVYHIFILVQIFRFNALPNLPAKPVYLE